MKIEVHIPDEMADYAEDIRWFVETQVRKLHINRHKNDVPVTLGTLMNGLRLEVDELASAMYRESQFETTLEAVDVANFAMLIGRALLQMDRKDYIGADEASTFRDSAMRGQPMPGPRPNAVEVHTRRVERCENCDKELDRHGRCTNDACELFSKPTTGTPTRV